MKSTLMIAVMLFACASTSWSSRGGCNTCCLWNLTQAGEQQPDQEQRQDGEDPMQLGAGTSGRPQGNRPDMSVEYNKLNAQAKKVLLNKHTERAWTGKYLHNKSKGTYICRRCNAPLYESSSKFESNCGWPSFDQELQGAVRREIDADGVRIEILCENCGGHLGHVFYGEGLPAKNTRHCVNSISMNFIAANKPLPEVIRPKLESGSEPANRAGKSVAKGAGKEPANGGGDQGNQEHQGSAGDAEDGTLESSKEDKAAKSSSKTPKGDVGSGKR